jgi:hypothetical protein
MPNYKLLVTYGGDLSRVSKGDIDSIVDDGSADPVKAMETAKNLYKNNVQQVIKRKKGNELVI